VVWKVCAVLPLVLLVVLMSVKVADGLFSEDPKETSQSQEPGFVPTTPAAPTPSESAATETEKDAEIKGGAPKPSELPGEDIATTTSATIPDSGFEIPPGPIDQTATAVPGPTKKPTKNPAPPSPTPTPDEAREQCIEDGVSVLNIAALAACIADLMDG